MSIKRVLLDLLTADQLKDICNELGVDADRRSGESMLAALRSAKRAKPEKLVPHLTVPQLREALAALEQPTDGRKEDLVGRLLAASGRDADANGDFALESEAGGVATQAAAFANPRQKRGELADVSAQYLHRIEAVQRPDAGVQDQFVARKPPKTYRFDSSLDPAMSWDEQRERDLGEWLIGLIVRAAREGDQAVFAEAQEWKGGGVRVQSVADAARLLQDLSKPFLNWAGKAERHEINVPTTPLFVHERHSTKAVLDGIRHRKARGQTLDLFGDSQLGIHEELEAYQHKGPWQNRMILGDALTVMNSLLEFEGMAGQVQMVYIDPPYGVKFGSNFQPFVRKRDVKHGGDEDMTREPEMVKAYRDTWELGLHSYLTYLRDRLMVAKELLDRSGSIFVQISAENLHHVRELLDEVFGAANFVSVITFVKSGSLGASLLPRRDDYIVWYAREIDRLKYRQLYLDKSLAGDADTYSQVQMPDGSIRSLRSEEIESGQVDGGGKAFRYVVLTKPGPGQRYDVKYKGRTFTAGTRWWGFPPESMQALISAGRVAVQGNSLASIRYLNDFPCSYLTNVWPDTATGSGMKKLYVVQTNPKVVQRCMLMCSDPGDLVLDPTCGSGTTAHVAEQWGRRWITIDTSRVPLALARQRLLTATFPYFSLKLPSSGPAGGFVYERRQSRKGEEVGGLVPHVTLRSIANDEPPAMEVLVDRPEESSGVTRVTGPFVLEAAIAPVQPLQGRSDDRVVANDASTHLQRMTEVLRQSKTLRLSGNRELTLGGVRRTSNTEYLHAEAKEGDKRVAIVFGPADGAVSATLVYEAGREAHYLKYDRLYFFGFAVEPNARAMIEDEKNLRIPSTYVAVTPDVAMSDLLKTTRASEIFSVTGLPDATVRQARKKGPDGQPLYEVKLNGLDLFDPQSMETEAVSGDNVPCWMLDSDYDGMCFYATQVFFPKTSAWDNLQRSLKAHLEESVWAHLAGTVSEPFAIGERRRVAVKVIDERGNELVRVLDVTE